MGERKQINLVVNEEQKDRWEDHAEDSEEVSSLSHLIRLAVEREISRDEQPTTGVDIDLGEVTERLDEMGSRMAKMEETIELIASERTDEGIEDLAAAMYDHLPRIPIEEEEEYVDFIEGQLSDELGPLVLQQFDFLMSLPKLADKVEASEYRARKAARQLEDDFARVRAKEVGGDTFVWEVVSDASGATMTMAQLEEQFGPGWDHEDIAPEMGEDDGK